MMDKTKQDPLVQQFNFFQAVYKHVTAGEIEIRELPSRKQHFYPVAEVTTLKFSQKENVFFAVATRNGGGTKEDILQIPCLWCDLDFKELPREQAELNLSKTPLKPSILVESGNGFHAYWLLDIPLGREDIAEAEKVLRLITQSLGGDNAATDASRILRVPGTLNHKYEPARNVVISQLDRSIEYSFAAIKAAYTNARILTNHIEGGLGGDNCSTGITTNVVNKLQSNYTNYNILQKGSRDSDLFKIGMALSDGHAPTWMIEQVLEKLALSASPPFPLVEAKAKVQSVLKTALRKNRNLTEETREWCLLQKGYFLTTELQHELQITTKEEKKHLTVIIVRLQEEGIIEKYGEKRGCYRTKDKFDLLEMKFIEEDIPEFDIKLPFGLNSKVSLYPKNIIMVAGSKSAGKTALLLNIALANQDTNKVVYLNSEMGDEEWSGRLKNLGVKTKKDIRYSTIPMNKNFHDRIKPDKAIYIIDFLEIHDNFYEIAKYIRQVHEALRDGICIIAVQKKGGSELGRGAEFSMEKARLYLGLDYLAEQKCSQLTIVDAKSPKVPTSLRGWTKRIKIINGSKMEAMDKEWIF